MVYLEPFCPGFELECQYYETWNDPATNCKFNYYFDTQVQLCKLNGIFDDPDPCNNDVFWSEEVTTPVYCKETTTMPTTTEYVPVEPPIIGTFHLL